MSRNLPKRQNQTSLYTSWRIQVWYAALIFVLIVFIARLFYLQVIRHDHYRAEALASQLKEYSIPAERGLIKAYENGTPVPLVLNQKLYTLYADPTFIKQPSEVALKLAAITHGDAVKYANLMKAQNTRYAILEKKLSDLQKDQITALKLPGIGTQPQEYRIYPQASLASQLLGFVDNDGKGRYGVEQELNSALSGKVGTLKAITDVNGVPLAASKDNIQIDPKNGSDVLLTIDLGMQKQLESYLDQDVKNSKSPSGSALIMDVNTGAVKAMANYPTYDPSQFFNVTDGSVFNNNAVSDAFEVGSVMKVLTASAALDQGVITPTTSYFDPGQWPLDGHIVKNVEEDGGAGPSNVAKILDLSMNTGATWMLMQMGHTTGEVNQTARDEWYDYMTNHFQFGKPTGIEQSYDAAGYVPQPDKGYALQLTYANTSFGQAVTVTPLQMAAALSSVLNGGTYYRPHLVDQVTGSNQNNNQSTVVKRGVVSEKVSQEMQALMEGVTQTKLDQGFSFMKFPDGYSVGGKTGTAQIPSPDGGYYGDRFNGAFIGFVGGDKPQYVIMVDVKEPKIPGYAGSTAAMPLFADLAHMLINNFNVTPKSGS